MRSREKLSAEEFKAMVQMIGRYVESEMDQWELWKFHSSFGRVYVNISMKPDASEDAYVDLNCLIDEK